MNLSHQRQGEFSIFIASGLWSLFPVITVLSYTSLPPLVSLAISGLFSACLFAIIMTKKKIWHEVINRKALKDILLTTFFIGILYYLLVFIGLKYTSPGNASIVSLTQVLFSFLFFHVLRREHIPKYHVYGALLMIIGAIIVLASNFKVFHSGDILILLANMVAPIGNFYAQKARKQVATETIMIVRSVLSTLFIFILVLILNTHISFSEVQNSIGFLLINGFLLLGLSKILWIDGIHRISVTKANALSSMEPLLTLFFAWMLLQQTPTPWQVIALIPICAGVILLGRKNTSQPASAQG